MTSQAPPGHKNRPFIVKTPLGLSPYIILARVKDVLTFAVGKFLVDCHLMGK